MYRFVNDRLSRMACSGSRDHPAGMVNLKLLKRHYAFGLDLQACWLLCGHLHGSPWILTINAQTQERTRADEGAAGADGFDPTLVRQRVAVPQARVGPYAAKNIG